MRTDKEIKCPISEGGFEITQLVFPQGNSASIASGAISQTDVACSYDMNIFTTQERNWKASVNIQVLGAVDLIKDGDQERSVQLMATIVAGGLNFGSVLVGKVDVSSVISLFYFLSIMQKSKEPNKKNI